MEAEPTLRILTPDEVQKVENDPVDPVAREQAKAIIDDIKANGVEALKATAVRLGDIEEAKKDEFVLTPAQLKEAFDALPADQQALLQRTHDRIKHFADAQMASLQPMETDIPDGRAGHKVDPVNVAGCYAPGGRYPLPSSVLMTAVTARAAGVPQVVVASPRPQPITLGAAHVAGADLFLAVGGAQSIAAMAFGVGVPACDIIVGPGNKWVTAAKSLVAGTCGIDMLAGPSEVLVIADETADPDTIAADLLAQAEHDVEARGLLVSPSDAVIAATNARLQARLAELPTAPTAREAIKKGFAVKVADLEEAVRVSDVVGPEHLEIQTADSQAVADRCRSYGGLFVGRRSAEALGDYGAGPNHVLPTGGTAKYTGGLSVFTFLRVRTWMRIDADGPGARRLAEDSAALARLEGLEGHARSAECRLPSAEGGEPGAKKARQS